MSPEAFDQIFIVGGTGQVGHRLLQVVLDEALLGKNLKVVATSRTAEANKPTGPLSSTIMHDVSRWKTAVQWRPLNLELTKTEVMDQLQAIEPMLQARAKTLVIVAAAFTNVDGCETDPARCTSINETNTLALLSWAKEKFQAKALFFSTDYVFDGDDGPYDEAHSRHAISVYGQSKVVVEEWLEKNSPESLIVRTTGVFDDLAGSKNFVMQMIELLSTRTQVRVPNDQWSNPVWAYELSKASLELVKKNHSGIFHVAGGQYLARDAFTRLIAEVFHLNASLIQSIATADLQQKALRPLKGGLQCEKVKRVLGWAPASASEVLQKFRAERK